MNLIVRLAGALADRYGGHITFMNILPEGCTAQQKAHSNKILVEAIGLYAGHRHGRNDS
ncbi:MAG: hypothetical protein JRH12_25490 [Deltaproteobacteria bacterium]|nr:hypothetical protein [Deltaproteobacteria bacterium]MBW2483280.1 hypothetical protein [Deltaproteobacteria bacterium]